MALPCASAKRSRLLPEVFDERSLAVRMFSPLEKVIIREMNAWRLAVLLVLSYVKELHPFFFWQQATKWY